MRVSRRGAIIASLAGLWLAGALQPALALAQTVAQTVAQSPAHTAGPSSAPPHALTPVASETPSPAAAPARAAPSTRPPGAARGQVHTGAGPTWAELSPNQRAVLAPLEASWSSMGEGHRRKWVALTRNYASLPPQEQAKVQARMAEWGSLTPQQRAQARLNYGRARDLTPEQRRARWEAYKALSPEERQRLRASAEPKPKGAALAARPVPAERLVRPPRPPAHAYNPTAQAPRRVPKIAPMPESQGSREAFLPQQQQPVSPAPGAGSTATQ